MKQITSSQNTYIKHLIQLKDKSRERKKTGTFLIEGVREITLALKGGYELETVLVYPNLFSEEKGVVAEGKLQDKTFFIADRILAKHDENYMPPELKNIMKQNVK